LTLPSGADLLASLTLAGHVMNFWAPSSPSMKLRAGSGAGIDDLRKHYESMFSRFGAAPAYVPVKDGQLGPIAGEWLGSGDRSRVILYFHGGGYIAGSPQSHRPLIARLVEQSGVAAFSVKYRLAPEFYFPAALRDGIDAYRGLLQKGVPGAAIVLAGDEAGGGLAFAVALQARNGGLAMPGGIAAMSPLADLSLSGQSMLSNRKNDQSLDWEFLFACARHTLRKSNPCDVYASPVFASFKDLPPVMVHAGASEVLRDDASRLGDRVAEADLNVSVEIYDGMGHLFQADPRQPEARASLGRLAHFIRNRVAAVAA
jgi:epsilon-lactone hydrolase